MISLKQMIDEQNAHNMSDIEVIKNFFVLNNMEEESVDLIAELLKIKINKLKREQRMVREWASYLPSKYLYEDYDLDIADKLHTLELNFLSYGGRITNDWLDWAKENIPNIKKPQVYFVPLVKWLEERNIKFQEN